MGRTPGDRSAGRPADIASAPTVTPEVAIGAAATLASGEDHARAATFASGDEPGPAMAPTLASGDGPAAAGPAAGRLRGPRRAVRGR